MGKKQEAVILTYDGHALTLSLTVKDVDVSQPLAITLDLACPAFDGESHCGADSLLSGAQGIFMRAISAKVRDRRCSLLSLPPFSFPPRGHCVCVYPSSHLGLLVLLISAKPLTSMHECPLTVLSRRSSHMPWRVRHRHRCPATSRFHAGGSDP